jgi:predicted secreted protein
VVTLFRTIATSLWATLAVTILIAGLAITAAVQLFGLTGGGGTALYFVIWWIVLFAVLPFGVTSQVDAGEVAAGTEPGAPAAPALREKAIWTTLVASVVLLIAAAVLPLAGL